MITSRISNERISLIGVLTCQSQSQKNTQNQCATKVNMSINGPHGWDYKRPTAYEMQIPPFQNATHTTLLCDISHERSF